MPFLKLGGTVLNTDYIMKIEIQDPDVIIHMMVPAGTNPSEYRLLFVGDEARALKKWIEHPNTAKDLMPPPRPAGSKF